MGDAVPPSVIAFYATADSVPVVAGVAVESAWAAWWW
jgi:hypothetical protein